MTLPEPSRDPEDIATINRLRHDLTSLRNSYELAISDVERELAFSEARAETEKSQQLLSQATFGSFDGMTSVAGIIFALLSRGSGPIVLASIGLAVASALGMAAGEYLSDSETSGGLGRAGVMGMATAAGTMIPVVPFFLFTASVALVFAGILSLMLATGIGFVRKKGLVGYLQTYGILVGAAVATIIVSLIVPASTGG